MSLTAEQVFRVVQSKGPIIPNKIKQDLGLGDSTLINVYLSDLIKEGRVKQTHVKLGTSFFFYTPDQRAKLAGIVKHTNEKQQRSLERLKQEGVMRASKEEPLTRVALQHTPDFSIPVRVKTQQGEETFFRWFLLSPQEAQDKIKSLLGVKKPEPVGKPVQEAIKEEELVEEERAPPLQVEIKKETPPQKQIEKPAPSKPVETQQKKTPVEKQTALETVEAQSEFGRQLIAYCKEKHITILSMQETRKDSEIDIEIELPTPVGNVKYFCRAKNKKSNNDGDIASTILSAKSRMLPAMYITTGTVTKKAKKNPELQECVVVEWA